MLWTGAEVAGWVDTVSLDQPVKEEMLWWVNEMKDWSGKSCSRWMKEVMTRAGITGYSGGSVRMAAASAAVDNGVPIDEVLRTGRWSSWLVFNKFYNRAKLRAVVPLVGRTSLA